MNRLHATLALSMVLAAVLAACTTATKPPPSAGPAPRTRPDPVAPKAGQPIDAGGLSAFLEDATRRLFQEGKLGTNLLQQLDGRKCRLALPACPTRALTAVELADALERSTAVVAGIARADDGAYYVIQAFSGFFISESGALVTSRVPMGTNLVGMTVMTRDGAVYPVREVLAGDPKQGVVILHVEGPKFTPLPIAENAPQGEPVWVLGHSDGRFFALTSGVVSGYLKQGGLTMMTVNAEFASGGEGGPVADKHGAVVGAAIVTAPLFYPGTRERQMTTRFCLASDVIRALLQPEEK